MRRHDAAAACFPGARVHVNAPRTATAAAAAAADAGGSASMDLDTAVVLQAKRPSETAAAAAWLVAKHDQQLLHKKGQIRPSVVVIDLSTCWLDNDFRFSLPS